MVKPHDVLAATEGRLQYDARVAINILSIVERELGMGASQKAAHVDRLRSLGMAEMPRCRSDQIRRPRRSSARGARARVGVRPRQAGSCEPEISDLTVID